MQLFNLLLISAHLKWGVDIHFAIITVELWKPYLKNGRDAEIPPKIELLMLVFVL